MEWTPLTAMNEERRVGTGEYGASSHGLQGQTPVRSLEDEVPRNRSIHCTFLSMEGIFHPNYLKSCHKCFLNCKNNTVMF